GGAREGPPAAHQKKIGLPVYTLTRVSAGDRRGARGYRGANAPDRLSRREGWPTSYASREAHGRPALRQKVGSSSFGGNGLRTPIPRQQLIDALGRMIRQPGKHVGCRQSRPDDPCREPPAALVLDRKKVGCIFGPRRWISAVPDWR